VKAVLREVNDYFDTPGLAEEDATSVYLGATLQHGLLSWDRT
jgi:hypothetical protein